MADSVAFVGGKGIAALVENIDTATTVAATVTMAGLAEIVEQSYDGNAVDRERARVGEHMVVHLNGMGGEPAELLVMAVAAAPEEVRVLKVVNDGVRAGTSECANGVEDPLLNIGDFLHVSISNTDRIRKPFTGRGAVPSERKHFPVIHDKRACAIQAHALVTHMDGPAGVEGVPEDVVVAVEKGLTVAVLIDIGPYGTAHRVRTTAIAGCVGQGVEERAALALRSVQQLVQASGVECLSIDTDDILPTADPVLADAGMGIQDLFSGVRVEMDHFEKVHVILEQLLQFPGPNRIPTAAADVRVQVTKIVIPKQENDPVRIPLLERNDILQLLPGQNPFPRVRIDIIPEEDNPVLLMPWGFQPLHGLPPEMTSVYVRYDNSALHALCNLSIILRNRINLSKPDSILKCNALKPDSISLLL